MRPATNQPKVSMIWASVKVGAGAAAGAGVAAVAAGAAAGAGASALPGMFNLTSWAETAEAAPSASRPMARVVFNFML